MKELTVIRINKITHDPEWGVLCIDGIPFFVTLELPSLNNAHDISCIPLADYHCKRRSASPGITAGLGSTFEVQDVPSRSDILFHVANYPSELRGCIAIGMYFDRTNGRHRIADSKAAFTKFMALMKGEDECSLEIVHV